MPTNGTEEPTYEGLRDAAVAGVRWIALARVLSEAAQLTATVVVARLVAPAEFGHAAIALILVPLAAILTFEGFGSALVQRQGVDREHLETAMLASLVAGLAMTAVTYLGAPLVCAPLFGDRTTELVQIASPLFLIAGFSAVSRSVLWRKLEFRNVSVIETGSVAVGAIVSVGLAIAGLEGEAIVLGAVAAAIVASALFMVVVRPARPRWHGRHLREILAFGGPASGAGLLHVAITNVDYTIVAARLGGAQVGFYWRAFQLGVGYQGKISGVMMQLAFPVYSRTKDLSQLVRLHERATRVHAAVVVPLLAILIVLAPVLIPWVFGSQWEPSVLPTQILAGAGMIAAVLTGFPQVLLAAGKPQALMRFNLGLLLLYAGAVFATVDRGIVAVSIAVVGVYVVQLVVVYAVLLRRVVGIPVSTMIGDLAPAAVGSIALVAVCLPFEHLLEGAGAPAALIVAVVGSVGLVVHCLVVRGLFAPVWHDLAGLARRVLPSSIPATALRGRRMLSALGPSR